MTTKEGRGWRVFYTRPVSLGIDPKRPDRLRMTNYVPPLDEPSWPEERARRHASQTGGTVIQTDR